MTMRSDLRSFQFNSADVAFLLQQINFRPLFYSDGTPVIGWDGTTAIYDAVGVSLYDPGASVIVAGSPQATANIALYGTSYASLTDIAGLRDVRGNINNLNKGQATWGAVDQPFIRQAAANYIDYTGQIVPAGTVVDSTAHPFASALDASKHKFGATPIAAKPDYAVTFTSHIDAATAQPVVDAHLKNVVDYTPRMISATITTGGVELLKDANNHIVFWDPDVYAAGKLLGASAAATAYTTLIDTHSADGTHHIDTTYLIKGVAIVDTTIALQAGQPDGNPTGATPIGPTGDANLYSGAGYGALSLTGQHDKQNTDENNITGKGNHEYFYGNVASIAGNAPNNGWFVLFGQFFDHGLDFIDKNSGYKITIPLAITDPLYGVIGQDGKPTTSITIVRATIAGQDAAGNATYVNHTSPYIDQSQTYGSHADVTQILREWVQDPNKPGTWIPGAKLLDGHQTQAYAAADGTITTATLPTLNELRAGLKTEGNRADLTWEDVTQNLRHRAADGSIAHDAAGKEILTGDVLLRDMNPHFDKAHLGSATGLAAMATLGLTFDAVTGQLTGGLGALAPYVNFADFSINNTQYGAPLGAPLPGGGTVRALTPAEHNAISELLLESVGDHYIAGDGRANENFGLTAVHHVWHEEHSFQVNNIETTIQNLDLQATLTDAANRRALDPAPALNPNHKMLHDWQIAVTAVPGATLTSGIAVVGSHYENALGNYTDAAGNVSWDQEKMFQAAKMTVEMEYQHIAVDQYARAVTPDIQEFAGYTSDKNAAITLEYSQTAFRFGHSTLRETIDTMDPKGGITGKIMSYALEEAFVNPAGFAKLGAGSIVLGMERQLMNEVDQYVTPALSQGLLGQPMDLGAINIARGRDLGLPTLNVFKAQAGLGKAYVDWASFQANMMHPERIADFVAAYSLDGDTTRAQIIVDLAAGTILSTAAQAYAATNGITAQYAHDFMHGGTDAVTHARLDNGGVDKIDLWIGGLAEVHVAGGVLGETFNAIFVTQIESLMDGDRFYYLQRLINQDFGNEIQNQQFKDIIERNTGVTHLNGNVFTYADAYYEMGKNARVATADLYDPSKITDLYRDKVKVYDAATNAWVSSDHTSTNLADLWGNKVIDLYSDATHTKKVFDAATLTWLGGVTGSFATPAAYQLAPLYLADGTYLGADQHKDGQLVNAHAKDSTFASSNGDGLGGLAGDQGLGVFTADDGSTFHNGEVRTHHIVLKFGDDTTPDAPVVSFDENFIYDARPTGPTKNLDGSVDHGTNSAEILVGTDHNDYLEMGIGDDTAYGGKGNDIIYGGQSNAGHNTLYGGDGNDYLVGGDAPDVIDGGKGDDWIFGMSSGSSVNGVDQLIGGDGNDHIFGGIGIDKMFGGKGDDSLYGGSDTDPFMYGGDGNDYLNGGSGQDTLFGGNGSDILDGGPGVDLLYGDNGDDILRPGPGVSDIAGNGGGGDVLIGGDGVTDTGFDFADYSQQNTAGILGDLANQGNASAVASLIHIDKKTGGLVVAATQGTVWFQLEGVIGTATNDRLLGDSPADASAAAVSHGDNWLIGGSGDDVLTGRGGNDVIVGGSIRLDRLIGSYNDQLYTSEVDGATHRVAATSFLQANGLLDFASGGGVTYEKHFQELLKSAAYRDYVLGDNFDWLKVDTNARALMPFSDSTHDVSVYFGSQRDYTITAILENSVTVAYKVRDDNPNGRAVSDGTDLVIGVEALKFADGTTRILDVAPTGVADHFAGTGLAAITGNVLTNDGHAAGTSLTASLVGQAPQHGTVTLQTSGQFSYVAQAGYVGKDFFIYQATDGYAASNPVLVTLTMAPTGATVASNDIYVLSGSGTTLTRNALGGLLANDLHIGPSAQLTVSAVNGKALATTPVATAGGGAVIVKADGSFIYTAASNAPAGTVDTFTYTASDGVVGVGHTDVGVVTITVHPGDAGPSLAPVTVSGNVADGYISGATVFADANGNGVADPGEATATTDANGSYTLVGGSGILVATGGTDVSTGLAFTGRFEAPEGSTAITPLTTLIVAMGGTRTANDQVAKAFGLATPIDITHFDPVAGTQAGTAGAKQVLLAGVAVAVTETMVAGALEAKGVASADAGRAAFDSIATQARMAALSAGRTVDLAAVATLDAILRDSAGRAGVTLDPAASTVIATAIHDSNTALQALEKEDGPTLLTDVGRVEQDALGPHGFINTLANSSINDSMANAELMRSWAHYDLYLAPVVTHGGNAVSIAALNGNGDVAVYSTADGSGHVLSANGTGQSVIAAGSGHDNVTLSNGADLLATGVGVNTVNLQSGDNQLRSEGNDTINVGVGHDQIEIGGNSVVNAGAATLLITVDAGATLALHTGTASVEVRGGYGGGAFSGGTDGHNLLVAGTGATTLYAGGDGDVLMASGGTGTTMNGWGGHETMTGQFSQGANVFNANAADAFMVGGSGTNVFNIGTGHANIVAALGTDLFNFVSGNANTTYIAGFKVGADTVHLSGFGADEVGHALGNALYYQGSEILTLRDGANIAFGNVTGLTQSSFV